MNDSTPILSKKNKITFVYHTGIKIKTSDGEEHELTETVGETEYNTEEDLKNLIVEFKNEKFSGIKHKS